MYKRLAEQIAERIESSGVETKASMPVYRYGAEMLVSSLGGILTVLALSLLFRELLAGIVYYVAYSLLRSSSGGYHASTHAKCYILSLLSMTVFFVLLCVVPLRLFSPLAATGVLASSVVIFALAPVGTPNKQLGEAETAAYRRRCRIILFAETALVAALLFFGQDKFAFVIANGFVLVAVMLIVGRISLLRHLRRAGQSNT